MKTQNFIKCIEISVNIRLKYQVVWQFEIYFAYHVFDIRYQVPFYLWRVNPELKRRKVWKCYDLLTRIVDTLIDGLENNTAPLVECFQNDFLTFNKNKCHLLVSWYRYETTCTKLIEIKLWNSNSQNFLGIVAERILNFHKYIFAICKRADRKLPVLARL